MTKRRRRLPRKPPATGRAIWSAPEAKILPIRAGRDCPALRSTQALRQSVEQATTAERVEPCFTFRLYFQRPSPSAFISDGPFAAIAIFRQLRNECLRTRPVRPAFYQRDARGRKLRSRGPVRRNGLLVSKKVHNVVLRSLVRQGIRFLLRTVCIALHHRVVGLIEMLYFVVVCPSSEGLLFPSKEWFASNRCRHWQFLAESSRQFMLTLTISLTFSLDAIILVRSLGIMAKALFAQLVCASAMLRVAVLLISCALLSILSGCCF